MLRRPNPLLFLFLAATIPGCAGTDSTPSTTGTSTTGTSTTTYETVGTTQLTHSGTSYRPRSFLDFIKIMERSPVSYEYQMAEQVSTDFGRFDNPPVLDPLLAITTLPDGTRVVAKAEPPVAIAGILESAEAAMKRNDMDLAFKLYESAVIKDMTYFKAHTYLGNQHFFRKEYKAAEYHLKKAIELNPLDYQAYFFLADTYLVTSRPSLALDAITHVLMLNRNNPNYDSLLQTILREKALRIREDRFLLPGKLRKRPDGDVVIRLDLDWGELWRAFFTCMAVWKWDPEYAQLRQGSDIQWFPSMFSDCLHTHHNYISSLVRRKASLTPNTAHLFWAIGEGYIDAIVYWELIAPWAPQAVLALPASERERIVEYIRNHVYEPI